MPNRIIRIYVAGPYTIGNPIVNVHVALDTASILWDQGFVPFVPHLSHFWHAIEPRSWDEWIEYDFAWLAVCDALYRLPGESKGADREEGEARAQNIPVFCDIRDLVEYFQSAAKAAEIETHCGKCGEELDIVGAITRNTILTDLPEYICAGCLSKALDLPANINTLK